VEFQLLRLPRMRVVARWSNIGKDVTPTSGLLLPADSWRLHAVSFFVFGADEVGYLCEDPHPSQKAMVWAPLKWRPGGGLGAPAPLAWLPAAHDTLEVAAVGPNGLVCWARFEHANGRLGEIRSAATALREPALAVTVPREGVVIAVTSSAVHWFRAAGNSLRETGSMRPAPANAGACFPHHASNELIVLAGNGTVSRVAPLRF
jgi:hypothetical protein